MFVSYTSNSQEQMFDFQKHKNSNWGWFRIFQDHQQNQNPGTRPMDNAVPYYTHDNFVGSLVYDECMK